MWSQMVVGDNRHNTHRGPELPEETCGPLSGRVGLLLSRVSLSIHSGKKMPVGEVRATTRVCVNREFTAGGDGV